MLQHVQVPFIGWIGDVPVAKASIQRLLQSVAKPFVSTFMKRTGQQFFMHDTEGGCQPLLVGVLTLPIQCALYVHPKTLNSSNMVSSICPTSAQL